MPDKIKLHVKPGSSRCSDAILLLEAAKADYELIIHNYEETKKPEFLKLNPLGRVPVLETPDGVFCYTNIIARYIGEKYQTLFGKDKKQKYETEHWLEVVRLDLLNNRGAFIYQIYGFIDKSHLLSKEEFNAHTSKFIKLCQVFETHLKDKKYLVGDALSAADLLLVAAVEPVYRFVLCPGGRSKLPVLTAYFENLRKQDLFKKVYGNLVLPDEPIYIPFGEGKGKGKHEEGHKEGQKDGKKEKEHKKEEHKEEKKPAEKAPAKKANDDEEEQLEDKKPEYKPPELKFNFHDFKTMFVNEQDKKKAIDYLWQNWDPQGLSIWSFVYDKLPTECQKIFLTKNLMNGFVDRADPCRKHTLGSVGVYGDEPNLDIKGVWLWRGPDMLPPLKDHQQFDVFKFKKLDPTNENDKKLITEYWTTNEDSKTKVDGQTVDVFKYFK